MEGRVLVIEDSTEILENIVEILELEKYEVFSAKDASAGMNLADKIKPNIILCDILIPGKGGFDVLQYVRSHVIIKSVPFIFVTSQSEKENIKKARDLGASDYIVKPFEGQTLIATIEQFIRPNGGRFSECDSIPSPTFLRPAEG